MTKIAWAFFGAILMLIAIMVFYNAQRTTRQEAGLEINEAAKATGDYIKDTANEVKQDIQT